MKKGLSRRDLLKGAAATISYLAVERLPLEGAEVPAAARVSTPLRAPKNGTILPLNSTSDVFIPPRGRSFQKFSFDFPEPSVAFNGLEIGYRIYTFENTYGLDHQHMTVTPQDDGSLDLECTGFVRAGGQEKAHGTLHSHLMADGPTTEWTVTVEMDEPVKSVAAIVRGVPRGKIAGGDAGFFDPKDNEILFGYPWGAARQARGIDTPLAVIQTADEDYFYLSALMAEVRANRLYFQPGETGYRVELVYEQEGWARANRLEGGHWRAGRTKTADEAFRQHYDHLERAFDLPNWASRIDVPDWFRDVELVLSIHGMHWTGYIFNDFAKALRTLEWTAKQIPGKNVMVFLPAWDGRYYWDYPVYKVDDRLGGEQGFGNLIQEGQRMGFHFVPMFGLNAANTELPDYTEFASAHTRQIDGNAFNLSWVDWDNDRHDEGWGRYMNVGVDVWRNWMRDSIERIIDSYGVDGYFLDIAAGWVNNTDADMHEGIKRLVGELHADYPDVLGVGEFSYDALMGVLPVYQVFPARGYPAGFQKYCKAFSHLSHPAPGRGSSGVHESGFGHFDPETLSLNPYQIPTITVVDDTFDKHRDVMAKIIAKAKERGHA